MAVCITFSTFFYPGLESLLAFQSSGSMEDIKKWHCRLGHLSFNILKSLFPLLNIRSNFTINELQCEVCQFSKMQTSYLVSVTEKNQVPFGLITWVYVAKSCDELPSISEDFHKMVENRFDVKMKMLRIGNGGEYTSNAFQNYHKTNWIDSQTSRAYTLEQHGRTECKNCHLLEVTRALLL